MDALLLSAGDGAWLAAAGSVVLLGLAGWLIREIRRLQRNAAALQSSEARFRAIAEHSFAAEAWFDREGRLTWVNRAVERITGRTPEECLQAEDLAELLVYDKDRRHLREHGPSAAKGGAGEAGGGGRNFEIRLQNKDGAVVWVALNWQTIRGADGACQGLHVSVREIQARKEAELRLLETVAELRRAQGLSDAYLQRSNDETARLLALLNVLKSGALFVDGGHRVIHCNAAFRRLWGFAGDENLAGVRLAVLVERTAALRSDDAAFLAHLRQVEASTATSEPFEITLADGRVISEVSAMVPGEEEGRYAGRVWIYEDVTEGKRVAAQLTELATRDPLTGLYNRRRFHEELERMLADAVRREGQVGLLSIDLDRFKPINDEFGHQAGDEVLVTIARQVSAIIRRNEMFFRLGGDEFAVLVSDTAEDDMVGLARRVGSRIEDLRFVFAGRTVQLTASLGIALYPTHAGTAEQLVSRADHAMYQAKSGGKNRWLIYRQ